MKISAVTTSLLFVLMLTECRNAENTRSTKLTRQSLRRAFEDAIGLQTPPVDYDIEDVSDSTKVMLIATFETAGERSYQAVALMFDPKGKCPDSSQLEKPQIDGVGPGGAGYTITFCVDDLPFKLTFASKLGPEDTDHSLLDDKLVQQLKAFIEQINNLPKHP